MTRLATLDASLSRTLASLACALFCAATLVAAAVPLTPIA